MRSWVTWAIIGVIVIFGIIWIANWDWNQGAMDENPDNVSSLGQENRQNNQGGLGLGENPDTGAEDITRGSTIEVEDQNPGNSVRIDHFEIPVPGYVVIHENNNGNPGDIIGRSDLLQGGEYDNFTVNLDRRTNAGETLFVMLHQSDNDNQFEFPGADSPIMENGEAVTERFMIEEGSF